MQNRKAMKYFSGNVIQRLPLYKVAMGGVAILLCAGIGASAMAAAFIGSPQTAQPKPEAVTIATAETATPTPAPTPDPTATPDKPVYSQVSVIQQDIGVELFYLADQEEDKTTAQAIDVQTADADTVEAADGLLPLTGVAMDITITDEEGTSTSYPVDTDTGTVLAEDVEPGDYTITFPQVEGFRMPEPAQVKVNEKVEYKADVEAVKDKIVQATEVVESQEDSSYGGGSAVVEEIVDTVTYADSSKEETSRVTVYTAQLSSDGHLLFTDGSTSTYLPVYDANNQLTGARRDSAASTLSAGAILPGVGLGRLLRHGTNAPAASPEGTAATVEPSVMPLEETGEPSAEPQTTPDSTVTPVPEATPTPEITPTPEPTPSPTPEVTPTPTPAPTPTPVPTPNDPTAGWPDEISAADLAGYGFSVTSQDQVTYQYTGWQTIDGKQYYYDPSNHQPVTGTQVIQGNVYTFAADGALNQTARGIDVSKYQGNIDWNAVAADGITFAIIRVGYRGYGSGALVEDSTFRRNIQGATAAGLKVGVYFYSQAINEAEAVEEASMVLSLVSGYSLPLGVYYDTEKVAGDTGRADGISAAERTACAVAFCETIRNAGYTAGVYSYASWFYNSLNYANISKYKIWIAQYRDTLDFSYRYDIWQYTSTGSVNGVPGGVDMNIG